MSESRQKIGTSHLVLNLKTLSDNPYLIDKHLDKLDTYIYTYVSKCPLSECPSGQSRKYCISSTYKPICQKCPKDVQVIKRALDKRILSIIKKH